MTTRSWKKYSLSDAHEDGKCVFDAGQPIDIGDKQKVYETEALRAAFKQGWLEQQAIKKE